jgi:Domain of unknown function (DUF4157)
MAAHGVKATRPRTVAPRAPHRAPIPRMAPALQAQRAHVRGTLGRHAAQPAPLIQAKLRVGAVDDPLEHEAARVADQVMRMPAPVVQRACCAGCASGGACDGKVQREATPGPVLPHGGRVDAALVNNLGPGRPLPTTERAFFEPRFGADLSAVRLHTGPEAGVAARAVDARAFTYGSDIALAPGEFRPGSHEGRRLIAHELTHVVQQTHHLATARLDPVPVRAFSPAPMLARACDPLGCPTVQLPTGIFVPSWQLAEQCLQDHYKKRFPGTVGVNKNWVGLTGQNQHERNIIECLKPHFTARGYKPKESPEEEFKPEEVERQGERQRQAEPDIFDFTNRRIMEITSADPRNVAYRTQKIAWEVDLANRLMGECRIKSPNLWQPGWWDPSPCYQVVGAGRNVAGKLFFRTWRVGGLLIYLPVLDITREAVAAVVATALVLVWKGLKRPKPPAVTQYAFAATAVAALLMFANGAEASVSLDDESILETFFKHAGDKGMKIPDDLKQMLKKNPKLRDLLLKAGRKGGDMSDEMRQAMEEVTRTIAENAGAFTDEELEQLAQAAGQAQAIVPNAKMTVEEIKRALKSPGRSQKADPGQKGGGAEPGVITQPPPAAGAPTPTRTLPPLPGIPDALRKRLADDKAATAILHEITTEQEGAPKLDATFAEKLLQLMQGIKPPLTEQEAAELAAAIKTGKGITADQVLESVRKAIARRRPAVPAAAPPEAGIPEWATRWLTKHSRSVNVSGYAIQFDTPKAKKEFKDMVRRKRKASVARTVYGKIKNVVFIGKVTVEGQLVGNSIRISIPDGQPFYSLKPGVLRGGTDLPRFPPTLIQ